MPMGNPLSPTIADIVLDDLLDNTLAELKNNNVQIKYITKYVDDILAIVDKNDTHKILNCFNKYHQKIQFTIEVEKEKSIAYLDTKLHHAGNKISFDWYTKETSSGRIMNYNATQPKSQIINTAKSLIHKILTLSDEQYHDDNIIRITRILINNSFPKNLINHLIKDSKRKINSNKHNVAKNVPVINIDDNERRKTFFSVKYIPGLIDNQTLKTTLATQDICFAYRPNQTLSTIFSKTKTPIEQQQQNNVVYEIPCKGDDNQSCDLVYIGTTKRALQMRIGEHKNDIEKEKANTALAQHIIDTGHTADFNNIKILDTEKRERTRMTLESLRIQEKITRTMNLKEDSDNISASYSAAIL